MIQVLLRGGGRGDIALMSCGATSPERVWLRETNCQTSCYSSCSFSGDLRTSRTETITAQTNHLLASLGLDPHTATIAHTLPHAASIHQSQGIPHSPPPPHTHSSLLTPPPSANSSLTQVTPILEDYMNYDLSDEVTAGGRYDLPLAARAKEC